MYEKHPKRRITKKAVFVFAGILIAFAVLVTGIILITNKKDLGDTIVSLPFSDSDSYVTVGNSIVYIEEDYLKCLNASHSESWQIHLLSSGLELTSRKNKIAAAGNELLQVVDSQGKQYFTTKVTGDMLSSRVCDNKAAVFAQQTLAEDILSYILVFDMTGNVIYQLDVTDKYILDYGFDYDSDLLYILELDTTGVVPISRISTYRPETQSMTGVKELKDQLIKSLYIIDGTVYALGTNQLVKYTSLGENEKEIVVYGWMLEDFYLQNQTDPKFIYIPSNTDENGIDIVRIVRSNGSEVSINLPPDVLRVIYMQDKVYCFTNTMIYTYTSSGKFLRSLTLPYEIDGADRAYDGYVFIKADGAVSLLPLS